MVFPYTYVSFLCSRKVALQKFDTNKLQKPCQYCVEVQVYVDLMKQSPPDESTIWEDVDGSATQLVSCRDLFVGFVTGSCLHVASMDLPIHS